MKLEITFSFLVLSLLCSLPEVSAYGSRADYKCPLGNYINIQAELDLRIPSEFPNNIPSSCQQQANSLKDQWKQSDLNDTTRISNQACSYAAGWLEYKPGTCQAGGPPPICPMNHWYRDPSKAARQHDNTLQELRSSRASALSEAACKCWESSISDFQQQSVQAQSSTILQDSSGSAQLLYWPCGLGCPPGLACVNGSCSAPQPTSLASQSVGWLLQKAAEYALEGESKILSESFSILSDQLDPTLDTWQDAYNGTLRKAQVDTRAVQTTEALLERANQSNFDSIQTNLSKQRAILQSDIDNLAVDAKGVIMDYSKPFSCPGVFQMYHNAVVTNLGILVNGGKSSGTPEALPDSPGPTTVLP